MSQNSKINVNFRVVGLYLGRNRANQNGAVVVEVDNHPTVFDIMQKVSVMAANGGISGVDLFSFTPTRPGPTEDINDIFVRFTEPPRSHLNAGLYFLSDSLFGNPITTFQYYIFNHSFVQLNTNNTTAPFAGPPDVAIEDGYTVIIRQVGILTGPNSNKLITRRAENSSDALNELAS